MAWHMARGQQSSRHTAQPGQMDVEKGKAGCPILCQPRPDLHQGQHPPANRAPRVVWAWGQGEGLGTKTALGIVALLHSQCPGGSELCQSPAATLILWHLWGMSPHHPPPTSPSGPAGGCVPMTLPRVGAQVCLVPQGQGGRQQGWLAGSLGQHPWGLPCRLVSTVTAACWPVPSVPGLSRGRQAQPGGISPLCHPAVALRASKQGAQLCHGTPA